MRGVTADAELAPDLGQGHLLDTGEQEYLARARWQRGDDRIEMTQLFGLGVVQRLFAPALALPVAIGDQVVGNAIQIGAAIVQQAAGGDLDDTQPGFLDDVIGIAALREFAADMGVQRPRQHLTAKENHLHQWAVISQ
ncbi:hypothetical protein G6F40_015671 [Rhizopus arrhizus]|nr:hypothetical protein G6F40_015671 [Rhizopus arrhizus]